MQAGVTLVNLTPQWAPRCRNTMGLLTDAPLEMPVQHSYVKLHWLDLYFTAL